MKGGLAGRRLTRRKRAQSRPKAAKQTLENSFLSLLASGSQRIHICLAGPSRFGRSHTRQSPSSGRLRLPLFSCSRDHSSRKPGAVPFRLALQSIFLFS